MDKKQLLEEQASTLKEAIEEALKETEIQLKGIFFGEHKSLNINTPEQRETGENPNTLLLYRIAKEFISFIRKIG